MQEGVPISKFYGKEESRRLASMGLQMFLKMVGLSCVLCIFFSHVNTVIRLDSCLPRFLGVTIARDIVPG